MDTNATESAGRGWRHKLRELFGIDPRTPDFWRASLDILRARIDQFVALAPSP